jgi:hypothetical protein
MLNAWCQSINNPSSSGAEQGDKSLSFTANINKPGHYGYSLQTGTRVSNLGTATIFLLATKTIPAVEPNQRFQLGIGV